MQIRIQEASYLEIQRMRSDPDNGLSRNRCQLGDLYLLLFNNIWWSIPLFLACFSFIYACIRGDTRIWDNRNR
jgi:hypothetical protein